MATSTTDVIERLRAGVRGRVVTPLDDEYDQARKVFYGGFENRRPAAIVYAEDANDVARVVNEARETGTELAVRSGGHSVAGHGLSNGGITLDLSRMRAIDIDPEARTAWVEPGLTAGEYVEAASRHDLVTGFGDSGGVGVGGITVGGGVGYLVRKHGLTIDDLLAAQVVTADGGIRDVDETNEPDLFWAIRGGGGNFGVVTRVRFRLHPLKQIVGGVLFLPATPDVIEGFVAAAEAAPEELSAIANVMPVPPMPEVPEEHHGRLAVMGMLCYAGDDERAGERAIAPFRALAEPIADMVGTVPYAKLFEEPESEEELHPIATHRSMFTSTFGREDAEVILDFLGRSDAMMAACQLRVLGGAMARVPNDATAYAHRNSKIMVNVAALFEDPADAGRHERWVIEFADALRQDVTGIYVNFLGDEGDAAIRQAYPGPTWDRLREIKARYDPTNLFRVNQNIPPADPA